MLIGAPSADWLGVPLKIRGQTIGVMVVQTYVAGALYKNEDMDMLNFVPVRPLSPSSGNGRNRSSSELVKQKSS